MSKYNIQSRSYCGEGAAFQILVLPPEPPG